MNAELEHASNMQFLHIAELERLRATTIARYWTGERIQLYLESTPLPIDRSYRSHQNKVEHSFQRYCDGWNTLLFEIVRDIDAAILRAKEQELSSDSIGVRAAKEKGW